MNFDIKVPSSKDKVKIMVEDLIKLYKSDDKEESLAKGIPLVWKNLIYLYSKHVKSLRIKYRGKSIKNVYNRNQAHCLMKYATSFAIYER